MSILTPKTSSPKLSPTGSPQKQLKRSWKAKRLEKTVEKSSANHNKIYNEDCLTYLDRLEDKSVDLFVLDPPYMNVVKDQWDRQWKTIEEYQAWCEKWIKLCAQKGKFSNSLWVFGFPYQLSHILPLFEKYGYSFRQQIVVWKGMKSAAGRTSDKLKMFPTTTESIFYFSYDSIPEIRRILNEKKNEYRYTAKYINEYLGKASNGGGTWSQIAGLRKRLPCNQLVKTGKS